MPISYRYSTTFKGLGWLEWWLWNYHSLNFHPRVSELSHLHRKPITKFSFPLNLLMQSPFPKLVMVADDLSLLFFFLFRVPSCSSSLGGSTTNTSCFSEVTSSWLPFSEWCEMFNFTWPRAQSEMFNLWFFWRMIFRKAEPWRHNPMLLFLDTKIQRGFKTQKLNFKQVDLIELWFLIPRYRKNQQQFENDCS